MQQIHARAAELGAPQPKPLPAGLDETGLERNDIGDAVLYYANDPVEVTRRLPSQATYTTRLANLEDVFLRLTGHGLREGD